MFLKCWGHLTAYLSIFSFVLLFWGTLEILAKVSSAETRLDSTAKSRLHLPDPLAPRYRIRRDVNETLYNDSAYLGDYESNEYGPGLSDDIWTALFKGPVCDMVIIRHTLLQAPDLQNCVIVSGYVSMMLINDLTEGEEYQKVNQLSFPKLRVITDYLMIYRVHGLPSLKLLFPNLAMIGGNDLFYDKYSLIIFENPDMTDIGLSSLRTIKRGTVRIQNNGNLCYLNTINWKRLGSAVRNTMIEEQDIYDNKDDGCIDRCSKDENMCKSVGEDDHQHKYCWGFEMCQKDVCPNKCSTACTNDSLCECHEECFSGCSEQRNASACFFCKNYYYEGTCVSECPPDRFLMNNWQCVTQKWCVDLGYKIFEKQCLLKCPRYYEASGDKNSSACVKCEGECEKICQSKTGSTVITDVESLKAVERCTILRGQLILTLTGSSELVEKLGEAFGELREVDALVIRRSFPLISLSFLRNLRRITGAAEHLLKLGSNGYSVSITDNANLQDLWDFKKNSFNLTIDNGKAYFHYNPRLCLRKIREITDRTKPVEDDLDISLTTNGDRMPCDLKKLGNVTISTRPAMAVIEWRNVYFVDYRTLMGYQIYFKESPSENATRFAGQDACGRNSWTIKDVELGEKPESAEHETSTEVFLTGLAPFTKYAVYVKAATTSAAKTGAESDIVYFITPPSKPSSPRSVSVTALSSSSILVQWNAPSSPNGNITHYMVRWRRKREVAHDLVDKIDTCTISGRPPPPKTQKTSVVKPTTYPKEKIECGKPPKKGKTEEEHVDTQQFEDYLINHVTSGYSDELFDFVPSDAFGGFDPFAEFPLNARKEDSAFRRRRSISRNDSVSVASDLFSTPSTAVEDPVYLPKEVNVTTNNYTLINLHYFTEYSFEIFACNHAWNETNVGCSIGAIASRHTKKSLSVDRIDPNHINYFYVDMSKDDDKNSKMMYDVLEWVPPADPNGIILYYNIKYKRVDEDDEQEKCCSTMEFIKNKYCRLGTLMKGKYTSKIQLVSTAGDGNWTDFSFTVVRDLPYEATPEARSAWISVGVLAPLVVLAFVISLFCWRKRVNSAKKPQIYASVNPDYSSIGAYEPDEYEVPIDSIELLCEIGHGHFGKVYEGLAKDVVKGQSETRVAVKTLHGTDSANKRMDFLKEASVMKAFNSHHVVRLLGVVSLTNKPMVVMEFMEHGDLKSFLRSTRPEAEGKQEAPLTLAQKLQMCGEIADGMAYLAELKFVHRDLAARNCLVHLNMTVKIGDFGLTRDVYETDYYRIDSKGILPVRWMAPESLKDGVFDSRSDVWSYGVVLWEIATLAEQPYQGLQHDQVTRFVIDGGYMEQPKDCPKKVYELMQLCWQYSPSMRPTFSEVVSSLLPDLNDNFKLVSFYHEKRESTNERMGEEDTFIQGSLPSNDSDMYSPIATTANTHDSVAVETDLSAYRLLNGGHQKDFTIEAMDLITDKDDVGRYVPEPTNNRHGSTIC